MTPDTTAPDCWLRSRWTPHHDVRGGRVAEGTPKSFRGDPGSCGDVR
jgi:hypothetical protein